MNEIAVRALTGAVYVALTLGAVWAGPFTTALLFLPVCMMAASEMHDLYWSGSETPPRYWSVLTAGAVYLVISLYSRLAISSLGLVFAFILLLILVSVAWTFWLHMSRPARFIGSILVMMLIVAPPFALLPHFHQFGHGGNGYQVLFGFFLLLWVNETGAYLVGRAIGRHKLSPSISPNKTIEGLVGGFACTLGGAWLISTWWPELSLRQWLVCAVLIAIVSTLGDLLESALKRSRGVKDSGTLLPGHGGILDRFDGFLLASPAVFIYLLLAS